MSDDMQENHGKKMPKAYENEDFLQSNDARSIRILSEYYEPLRRLKYYSIRDTVVFYGSARIIPLEQARNEFKALEKRSAERSHQDLKKELERAKHRLHVAEYYEQARELARRLTEWSLSLKTQQRFVVCSGGGPGIMEAANRGALEAGGRTVGMNISIPHEQYPNPYITENLSFEFHYFFMRKFWFVYLAKALVVFPGGFGTMDELFELLTLLQTRKVTKPLCCIVYGSEFWNSIVNFEKMVEWGVISEDDLKLFHLVDDVETAFETLKSHFEREFMQEREHLYL